MKFSELGNRGLHHETPTGHSQSLESGKSSEWEPVISPPADASDIAATLETSNVDVGKSQKRSTPESEPAMPSSSQAFEVSQKGVFCIEPAATNAPKEVSQTSSCVIEEKHEFSMPTSSKHLGMIDEGHPHAGPVRECSFDASGKVKEENYAIFRTKSISRQLSAKSQQENENPGSFPEPIHLNAMPSKRYFDALTGPELEILKDSEELLLPCDQRWPFLLRFPIVSFSICLGLGSQTILWKTLAMSSSMRFLHIPLAINLILWCLSLFAFMAIFITYTLKCLFYYTAVCCEYYHPVRINFFFAPWIGCMFLAIGLPPCIATSIHPVWWCLFIIPICILELKIYGQWLLGGRRRLSKVANPSTHLSLVGNFVGAILAATVGWREPAVFFWAVGCAHYLVLFVTLYQRLPSADVLPKELHPVFFLFVSGPSIASVAWKSIVGEFDHVSRVAYFVGLFLYFTLAVRINFFHGFQFSLSWWAYSFPMTASAIATIHYSLEMRHQFTQVLAVLLSLISAVTVFILFISTILHGIYWKSLFPNDKAIAITNKKHKRKHKGSKSYLSKCTSGSEQDYPQNTSRVSENSLYEDHKPPGILEMLSFAPNIYLFQ